MPVLKRPGTNIWHIEFEAHGRRVRRSARTTNKRKAEELERNLRQELHEQVVLNRPVIEPMTLGEAVVRYVETHLALKQRRAKTASNDVHLLNKLVEYMGGEGVQLSAITGPQITGIRDQLIRKGRKPATVNRYLATLRAILRKARDEWGTLGEVPRIKLLPQDNERIRWLTLDEEARLLDAACSQPHIHDLIVFLLGTGARLAEALELCWSEVDLKRQPRPMVSFLVTKKKIRRSVPLDRRTEHLLRRLYAERPKDEPRVFLRRLPGTPSKGTKPSINPISRPHGAWSTAVKKAKIDDLVMHDLRHTFASRLIQRKVPIVAVSKLLGHKNLKMTMRYAHLAPDDLDEAISVLDDL